jgi:MFS family permease
MTSTTRLVVFACCLMMLAVGENSTAIMAALPVMTTELPLTASTAEWAVNAYLLASAVFIIVGGEAAERFGARRSSAIGGAVFAAASLLIALAPDGLMVIIGRALQGLGAALAVPGTLAAVSQATTQAERAHAIGAWTGFLMLGFSIGPLVGGAVTHYVEWRANFVLSGLLILPGGLVLWLRAGTPERYARQMDWLGLALLACFMLALTYGLHALAGDTPWVAGVLLAVALAAFAALYATERRRAHPLLDFALFREGNFALGCALVFLLMFDIIMLLLYYNLFAQAADGLRLSAVGAGLSLMPLCVALFAFARGAPRIAAAIGLKTMMIGGSLLLVAGCAIAIAARAEPGLILLLIGLFVIGAGIALPYASAPHIALTALPESHAGKGSGIINACSFLGGTVGVTCGGLVFGRGGFPAVLVLAGISALLCGGLSLRLRASPAGG